MEQILQEVRKERERQKELAFGGNTDDFDKTNSQSDWVAYIVAYAGRAPDKVYRNKRQEENFRNNMVKVAALALAAIESFDAGYCT